MCLFFLLPERYEHLLAVSKTNFQVLCTSLMFYKKNIPSYWAPLTHMLTGASRRPYHSLGLAFLEWEFLIASMLLEGLKTTVESEWRLQEVPSSQKTIVANGCPGEVYSELF